MPPIRSVHEAVSTSGVGPAVRTGEAGLVVLARPKPVASAAPAPGEASRDEVGHHSSANRWWMSRTAIEPSPNAETTRLTEPE